MPDREPTFDEIVKPRPMQNEIQRILLGWANRECDNCQREACCSILRTDRWARLCERCAGGDHV